MASTKSFKALLAAFTLSLTLTSAFGSTAGSGHSHSVNKETIKNNSFKELKVLVENESIKKSWLKASFVNMRRITRNKKSEWIVSYENEKITNVDKKKIYLFLSSYGKLKGANYTGK